MASFNPNIPVRGNPFLDIPSDIDAHPFRLVWEDICSVSYLARLLPSIFLPVLPLGSGPLDELYPNCHNLCGVSLHVILIISQVFLTLSLPVALAICWIFPTGVHIAFIAAFTFFTMVIVRLLNGPPTGRSLIGIPQTRDPVNDETEPWFFINGIATGKHWHQSNLTALADTFGRQIVGIHNPTKGVILDLVECLIQRDLEYKTADIRQGRAQLRAALAASTTKKAVLIVHSQGGIVASSIIDWLYGELSQSQIQKLEIYTFGNAARQFRNPPLHELHHNDPAGTTPRRQIQGERAIRNIEHYANTKDFVANIGALQFTASAGAYSNASVFSGTVFIREGSGHLFNMHYLHPMFGEHSAFMESTVDVRPRNGPGKTVSMRMRELSRLYNYKNGRSPEDQDAM